MLQHANILLNPLCQRLDRSYGVALVRWSFLSRFLAIAPFVCLVCRLEGSDPRPLLVRPWVD